MRVGHEPKSIASGENFLKKVLRKDEESTKKAPSTMRDELAYVW